jgi:light-regulated signal transduction histidine kinase (bacteriophytochrome)
VYDEDGKGIELVGFARDISARREAERALARYADELARSNAELQQFAYIASHDLQEPLRKVKSFTQLLAEHYGGQLDEKADKYINYIVDGASRMQTLITDLLTYSRVSTKGNPFEPTSCDDVLDRAIDNLEFSIKETSATIVRDPLPTVMADAVQLVQLFQNLIGNAIKFHGETVPRINISAQRQNAEWVFSVKDNGIGFDPQHAERIFAIFQRLHARDEYPGTGIGLAVCKRIIERHGGRIWAESAPGQGSTFRFTLPTMAEQGGAQP